jgi:o-succinylbenzoate synthase
MSSLVIASHALVPIGGALSGVAANARARWRARRGLALRLVDDAGAVGWGEASPLPGYRDDTLDQAAAALETALAAPLALALDGPLDRELDALLDARGLTAAAAPAARFALETALLDLGAQRAGVSLAALLTDGAPSARVPLAALTLGEPDQISAAVERGRATGISTFKLKVGARGRFDAECALLASLRARHRDAIALRLDANGAWQLTEAPNKLATLAAFAPELVEQPVAASELCALADAPVPIAADESVRGGDAAIDALLATPAVTALVLKPMALGGALRCRAIARRASARGRAVIVSHLFDGPIALAAAAELARALGGSLAAGLAPHAGLDAWPPVAVPQLARDAIVAAPGPGLGVALPAGATR